MECRSISSSLELSPSPSPRQLAPQRFCSSAMSSRFHWMSFRIVGWNSVQGLSSMCRFCTPPTVPVRWVRPGSPSVVLSRRSECLRLGHGLATGRWIDWDIISWLSRGELSLLPHRLHVVYYAVTVAPGQVIVTAQHGRAQLTAAIQLSQSFRE